jgi:uncharacterized repeat protein (TIGR01451 family)
MTFTIWLVNSDATTVTADVVDELPEGLHYVAGSVTGGGVYDEVNRKVSWEGVQVPPGNYAAANSMMPSCECLGLSFVVTGTAVEVPVKVINTAIISGAGDTLERSADVWLVPNHPIYSLDGVKLASQEILGPDEVLTYTIVLYNRDITTITADVVDELPERMNYVAGSVAGGGVYHADSRTIIWEGVEVPPVENTTGGGDPSGVHLSLSFAVTATVDERAEVRNTAVVSTGGESFELKAWVLLVPEEPGRLDGLKIASQSTLGPDEVLTYTIVLYNRDSSTVTADVIDELPEEVNYVAGSVTGGGVYNAESRTIVWEGVEVPPGGAWDVGGTNAPDCDGLELSFAVTATVEVPTEVRNTAVISADGHAFERKAWVLLIPERPMPGYDLAGSRKMASQYILAPEEVLTYTIWLNNSGTEAVVADVTDPLPLELNYVAGSVTGGGVYDPDSRTITWDDVTVPPENYADVNNVTGPDCEGVALTFAVTATVDVPVEVVNTAIISANGEAFEREVWVKLVPERPNPCECPLDGVKTASQHMLAPEEVLTYTIVLYNSDSTTVTADVMDPLPRDVNYVPESVTGGGVYDAGSETIYWNGVVVPPTRELSGTTVLPPGHLALSFAVTATVDKPAEVLNTAIISVCEKVFERHVWVLLVPERPTPKPNLDGSFKKASRRKLPPGELLTYTIVLHNSGTREAIADVTDLLPPEVDYVPGSATPDAVYDEVAGTLEWSDVEVPAGWDVHLSFAVTPHTVTVRTLVTNTAVISTDGESFERYAEVWLLPDDSDDDHIRPVVHSLTIDGQDVLDSPTVTLHISATDNVGIRWMYLREWEWVANPWPHWRIVQNSEWVPHQADYPWTLGAENGTHFVGVWLADDAHNISKLDLRGIDFASLVQPGATVPEFGMTPYLVYYEADVDVSSALTLTSATGYVAMDVWYARNFFVPIATDAQTVTFTTQTTGTYVFVVYGEAGSKYDLSIEPGGGPRLPLFDKWGKGGQMDVSVVNQAASGAADDLVSMLTVSGLDPLGDILAPSAVFNVYLPVVLRSW